MKRMKTKDKIVSGKEGFSVPWVLLGNLSVIQEGINGGFLATGRSWAESITHSGQEQSINAICDYLLISFRLNISTLEEDNEAYTHLRDNGSKKKAAREDASHISLMTECQDKKFSKEGV